MKGQTQPDPEVILREPYSRIVIPDEDGYHAEILEFPGCYAQGDSAAEAYANLEKSARSWVEACLEDGQEIPPAFSNVGYSGRIVLRLPKSIHRQAARFAERDGVSLNQFLVSSVASRIGAEDFGASLSRRLASQISKPNVFITISPSAEPRRAATKGVGWESAGAPSMPIGTTGDVRGTIPS